MRDSAIVFFGDLAVSLIRVQIFIELKFFSFIAFNFISGLKVPLRRRAAMWVCAILAYSENLIFKILEFTNFHLLRCYCEICEIFRVSWHSYCSGMGAGIQWVTSEAPTTWQAIFISASEFRFPNVGGFVSWWLRAVQELVIGEWGSVDLFHILFLRHGGTFFLSPIASSVQLFIALQAEVL